jgi:hypothetical protein
VSQSSISRKNSVTTSFFFVSGSVHYREETLVIAYNADRSIGKKYVTLALKVTEL